jgi:hypothetical protein
MMRKDNYSRLQSGLVPEIEMKMSASYKGVKPRFS